MSILINRGLDSGRLFAQAHLTVLLTTGMFHISFVCVGAASHLKMEQRGGWNCLAPTREAQGHSCPVPRGWRTCQLQHSQSIASVTWGQDLKGWVQAGRGQGFHERTHSDLRLERPSAGRYNWSSRLANRRGLCPGEKGVEAAPLNGRLP